MGLTQEIDAVAPQPRRRSVARRSLIISAVVLVISAGPAVVWSVARPPAPLHVFGEPGGEAAEVLRAGVVHYESAMVYGRGSVHVDEARAVVTGDTTAARPRVFVCDDKAGADFVGAGTADEVRRSCRSFRAFRPGDYRLGAGRTDLYVEVVPSRPGTLTIAGVRLRYHRGDRHGDEVTGLAMRFRVSAR